MTRKTLLIVVGLMAVVGLTFGFATTGLAFSGGTYTGACSGCHTGTATNPVAALVSNDGSTATYNVSNGGTEWALFNGSTRVTGAVGATGQFTVPVPGTYTLFAVAGTAGGGTAQGLGQTTVVVAAPLSQFIITATAGSNGAIDPSGAYSATQGDDVTYTFTPDSGYHVTDVTVDGDSVGGVTSYTFRNVQAVHTIAVTFAPGAGSTYTITATAGDHGSINPIGDRQVTAGGSIIYTMQPAEGYRVATITVDGVPLPLTSVVGRPKCTDGWYTFLNVVKTHTIDVTFKPNAPGWFTVTPYAGEHGTIWMPQQTVQGTATIPGALVACSIMPDSGYHVETLEVDGQPVAPATWYIFYNVRAGHTIAATFAPGLLLFNITASAGANGHISQEGVLAVTQGDDVTYTFTPDSGYHVEDVTVDGVSVGSPSSRTFTNVQGVHTIAVTFAANAPAPKLATSLGIMANRTSVRRGTRVYFHGVIKPNMPNGTHIGVYVRKSTSSTWHLVSVRHTFGSRRWSYYYHPGAARGTYYIKVRYIGNSTFAASTSKTIKVVWR